MGTSRAAWWRRQSRSEGSVSRPDMSNLLSSLLSSSNALNAFDRVLAVTQNNVANASTPGYARQSLLLEAMPFDLISGSIGGVRAGQVASARNEYAEQAVRRQSSAVGYDQ